MALTHQKVAGAQFSDPGYLPLRAAATWAPVSQRTIQRWITRGLPKHQAGPREKVLIRPADIEAFLNPYSCHDGGPQRHG